MNNKTYKDYMYMNMINYSYQELETIHGELEVEYEKYAEAWAKEAAKLVNDGIDPYSYLGEKKLKKLAKKHASTTSDILIILENIENELDKRDKANEEAKYSGKGTYKLDTRDKQAFIDEEHLKTISYRKGEDNKDEN